MENRITSRDNEQIKYACKLAASAALRSQDGLFFAEGPKLCLELAKGCPLKVIYITQAALTKTPELSAFAEKTVLVSDPVADKLAGVRSHQGVFALFETPRPAEDALWQPGKRLLALEGVQDPGNVGTLLRSAAAFGFDGVLCDAGCAAPFSPKTLRASMGAAARIPVWELAALPPVLRRLRQAGVTCLAAALYDSVPLDEAPTRCPGGLCVVVGSEGQGLSHECVAACDKAVRIPMTDRVESLNAGVAGSILLWQFRGV